MGKRDRERDCAWWDRGGRLLYILTPRARPKKKKKIVGFFIESTFFDAPKTVFVDKELKQVPFCKASSL